METPNKTSYGLPDFFGMSKKPEKYSEESGWILPNPCSELQMECEGDCKNCPNKNYWCPECGDARSLCECLDGTDW